MCRLTEKTTSLANSTSSSSQASSNGKITATNTMTKSDVEWSCVGDGKVSWKQIIIPLFLMSVTPCFGIVFYHVMAQHNGNVMEFVNDVSLFINNTNDKTTTGTINTILTFLYSIWPTPFDMDTWFMIGSFLAFELILMKIVPGKMFTATVTPAGHRPVYKANGTACYIITLLAMLLLNYTGLFKISLVYDKFGTILSSMNVFAWIFCTMLLIKGYISPSSSDSGSNGNLIVDFYWGMELFPRIYGWDVKQFTNCRAGLMFWAVSLLAFCAKNMELRNGQLQLGLAVSCALQLVYLSKFYHWEMGYMCSMDIQHDRAGYYICWGCLVWVPSVYTSASFYLTTSAPEISVPVGVGIFLCGLLCIWINYDSDNQRYIFRQSNGQCTIWGRTPPKHVVAKYVTASGDTKSSLLLVDGWWKISRHFHYVPEILASFFWSVSALDTGFICPYFYVIYLTILLTHRAFRDDDRCSKKYGRYWKEYCATVPYKIIPGVV